MVDHGAVPDDGEDDIAAIRAAIAAAAEREGRVVIGFPPGRFILHGIVYLDRDDLVLRGAGSGDGGTEIHVPVPLGEMELPASLERTRQYLIDNDKRVDGKLFSAFSWTDAVHSPSFNTYAHYSVYTGCTVHHPNSTSTAGSTTRTSSTISS